MDVKGCDANATNKFGMVPLHHAAVHGDPNVIEALIKGGGEVCILSKISFSIITHVQFLILLIEDAPNIFTFDLHLVERRRFKYRIILAE